MAEIEQIHGDEADGTAIDVGRVKAFVKRAHQALARQASARSCFTAAARRGRWERWRFAKSRTLFETAATSRSRETHLANGSANSRSG